jgi:hypothetical protein
LSDPEARVLASIAVPPFRPTSTSDVARDTPNHPQVVCDVEIDFDSFDSAALLPHFNSEFHRLTAAFFGRRIAHPHLSKEKHRAEGFCYGVLMERMMPCRRMRGSTSTPYENSDNWFRANGKTRVTRTLHIVFFLWLVVSIAAVLTAISQRRAIIELLRTASSASTPPTLTLPAQPWNPWTYGAQSLACDLPFPDARRETAC